MDHESSFPGNIEDYQCGDRSYDTESGYNHQGTDYILWPFAWNLVEDNAVQVVAAAPGTIIGKDDGSEHYSCSFSSENWNAVYLMHADGSTSWYGHMKKNSLTTKMVGESVEAGEYLGIVASSGNSTAPHLHFEVYDINANLVDPYAGDCNIWNQDSWWAEQPPYFDPAINKIQTHFAPPDFNTCPELENINAKNEFEPGEQVYFVTYFKDQRSSNLCRFSIIQPNNEVFDQWIFNQPQNYLAASYWYWDYVLPSDAMEGVWTFKCDFVGKTYLHEFTVGQAMTSVAQEKTFANDFKILQAKDQIIVTTNNTTLFAGEIWISDIGGRILYKSNSQLSAKGNSIILPADGFSKGIYFVTLSSYKNSIYCTRKVVLN